MKTKDLRIGNLVYVKYTDSNDDEHEATTRVLGVHEEAVLGDGWRIEVEAVQEDFYECVCEPIKLTEEILSKCGFKENKFSYVYEDDTRVSVYVNDDFFFCQIDNVVINNIKYLHQLQNLYFALTGTELEIEL